MNNEFYIFFVMIIFSINRTTILKVFFLINIKLDFDLINFFKDLGLFVIKLLLRINVFIREKNVFPKNTTRF